MMCKASRLIYEHLTSKGIKCRLEERDSFSYVEATYNGDNFKSIDLLFISEDDDNDVQLKVFNVASVPEGRHDRFLTVCNDLNKKFRYAKFFISSKDTISVEFDFCVELGDQDVGAVAYEMCRRFPNIIDDAYPELMRAMWG